MFSMQCQTMIAEKEPE